MNWIKANKTKLYRLVAEYTILPKMKYTSFIEVPDCNMYGLEWNTEDGANYRACYLIVSGYPRLVIQYKKSESDVYINHTIDRLDIGNLIKRGMIKGVRHEHQIRNANQQLTALYTH